VSHVETVAVLLTEPLLTLYEQYFILIEYCHCIEGECNMSMNGNELRSAIEALGLTQAEFARLVGVSVGAVAQWLSEARSVPGPVQAYLSLLMRVPSSIREYEIAQIRKGSTSMKNGMYLVHFQGSAGEGYATLTFVDGIVYGYDETGAQYDGFYAAKDGMGNFDVTVHVKMKANTPTVAGGISKPFDWVLTVSTTINANQPSAQIQVMTSLNIPIGARYTRMRDLPAAA
jgi:hypothetical protein